MFSFDDGKTWDTDHVLFEGNGSWDMGYPSTAQLPDGTLLTVFYARPDKDSPAVIWQQTWRFER